MVWSVRKYELSIESTDKCEKTLRAKHFTPFSLIISSKYFEQTYSNRDKPTTSTVKKSWDERFQELLEYKREHGHTRVPRR